MALVTVNGFVGDFGGVEPGLTTKIEWVPSAATVSGAKLLFTRKIVTNVNPTTGAWSEQFEAMDTLTEKVWLSPVVSYFESDLNGGHWVPVDFPNLKLIVPSGGPWDFTSIVEAPSNPDTLVWGYGPPVMDYTPGTWYYDASAAPGTDNFYIF